MLLHQSTHRRASGHHHLFLLQASHEREASASNAQRKAPAVGSRRRSSNDELAPFLHTRTPIWRSNASVEQQRRHWLVGRLRRHPRGFHRLGDVPKRICHDRTTPRKLRFRSQAPSQGTDTNYDASLWNATSGQAHFSRPSSAAPISSYFTTFPSTFRASTTPVQ